MLGVRQRIRTPDARSQVQCDWGVIGSCLQANSTPTLLLLRRETFDLPGLVIGSSIYGRPRIAVGSANEQKGLGIMLSAPLRLGNPWTGTSQPSTSGGLWCVLTPPAGRTAPLGLDK